MSLEARLNQAFDHATRSTTTSSDVVLTRLIASLHHQRRQRAIWLAAAAVTAVVILAAGDNAAEWIRSMERDIAPVENGQGRVNEQLEDEDRTKDLDRRLGSDDGTGLAGFSAGISERGGQRPAWIDTSVGRMLAAGEEGSHGGTAQEDESGSSGTETERDLTRIREKKWSTGPLNSEGSTTTFWVHRDERHIKVELRETGGGGFGRVMGEVYEILEGVPRSLGTFCGSSGVLDVTPGSRIEVHAHSEGCDGSGLYLKGLARMLFYR